MIAIRLSGYGRKKAPFYRIVAVDSRKKAKAASFLEILGFWNPATKEFKIKSDELKAWVGKGALVSPAVKKLMEK